METMIFAIDPTGTRLYFALLLAIAALLGAAVYRVLARPETIRTEFRGLFRPAAKRTAAAWAVVAMLPLGLYGYRDCWTYFYAVRLNGDRLILTYLFPTREQELADLGSISVTAVAEARKGLVYRIRVDAGGRHFVSQQMPRPEAETRLRALTQALQQRTGAARP